MDSYTNYLEHYGILGMKWGVRRYQNPDGTLTAAGKKRYGGSSGGVRLHKDLKKQIREKRKDQANTNEFRARGAIGKRSSALIEEKNTLRKEYRNSKEYKEWEKKVEQLNSKYEALESYADTTKLDSEWRKLMSEKPKQNFEDFEAVAIYTTNGYTYSKNFINGLGKEMSLAYLEDLGYNREVAEDFVKRMAKSGKTLGMV